jgi:hypothetical protein
MRSGKARYPMLERVLALGVAPLHGFVGREWGGGRSAHG